MPKVARWYLTRSLQGEFEEKDKRNRGQESIGAVGVGSGPVALVIPFLFEAWVPVACPCCLYDASRAVECPQRPTGRVEWRKGRPHSW